MKVGWLPNGKTLECSGRGRRPIDAQNLQCRARRGRLGSADPILPKGKNRVHITRSISPTMLLHSQGPVVLGQ